MAFTPRPLETKGQIKILDPLRGIAAFAVVIFHYGRSVLPTVRPNPLEDILAIGNYGVHVFFVISGFVIPYALHRSRHRVKDIGRFMIRRFVRIAPPAYLASMAVILFFALSQALFNKYPSSSEWPGINPRSILGNLLFMPKLFGTLWFNFPYWTLLIEFQFYLVIGIMLPFMINGNGQWRIPVLLTIFLLSGYFDSRYLLHFSPLFTLGIIVFLHRSGSVPTFMALAIAGISMIFCLVHLSPMALMIGGLTAAIIWIGPEPRGPFVNWLGRISYSLYITHVPVAFFSEAVLKRLFPIHHSVEGKLFMLVVYTLIALLAAGLFHRFIEAPFAEFSKRMYRSKVKREVLADETSAMRV